MNAPACFSSRAAGPAARRGAPPGWGRLTGIAATLVLAVAVLGFAGCGSVPRNALTLAPDSDAKRQLQTRHFDGIGETELLTAATAAVQDLGFTLEKSDTRLGVVTASRQLTSRRPPNAAEVTRNLAWAALDPALGGALLLRDAAVGIKEPQWVRLTLATTPTRGGPSTGASLRVTAQRVVYKNEKFAVVKHVEPIKNPQFYEAFFARLAQSAFLEKQKDAL